MSKTKYAYCFPASFKLKNNAQIRDVFNHAKKYQDRNWSFFVKPNRLNHPRLAIIITNKQVSKAAIRNRLKRIIRENFRLNQDKIKDNDIIAFGYKGIEKLTNKELMQCLTKNWQRLN